jgi:hypothetical protein
MIEVDENETVESFSVDDAADWIYITSSEVEVEVVE